ncbi:hypothetical protein G7Y89_g1592 [Cudoniella acicularis]|uniref:Uncharacterized protein n=1 Tax=Cudoniella acicularis TaxID=354080 RepID=A0A8H4RUY6_9HELO|nr:hypothetical protein G7Y89_g1592 [Cudoniella acicularis]
MNAQLKAVSPVELNTNPELQRLFDCAGWRLAAKAGIWEATDPKDYVYGLLGITGRDITPDYSPGKSATEVYCEFFSGWLKYAHRVNELGIVSEEVLHLLHFARIGFSGTPRKPLWAPDFPRVTRKQIHNLKNMTDYNFLLNLGALNSYTGRCNVRNSSLFVSGVRVEPLIHIRPIVGEFRDLAVYIFDFIAKNPVNVTGYHPLLAITQVLNCSFVKAAATQQLDFGTIPLLRFLQLVMKEYPGGLLCAFHKHEDHFHENHSGDQAASYGSEYFSKEKAMTRVVLFPMDFELLYPEIVPVSRFPSLATVVNDVFKSIKGGDPCFKFVFNATFIFPRSIAFKLSSTLKFKLISS